MSLSPLPQYETSLLNPEDVASRFTEALHHHRYLEAPCAHRHLTLSQLRNMTRQDTVHQAAVLIVLRELNNVLDEIEKGIVREGTKVSFPRAQFFARQDKRLVAEFRWLLEGFSLHASYHCEPAWSSYRTSLHVRYRVRPELRDGVRAYIHLNGYRVEEARFDSRFDVLIIV